MGHTADRRTQAVDAPNMAGDAFIDIAVDPA
jgi:hypothetical protein